MPLIISIRFIGLVFNSANKQVNLKKKLSVKSMKTYQYLIKFFSRISHQSN